jgi:hypothetical protein
MANKKCEHDRVKSTCSVCSVESVYRQYQYKAKARNLTFRLTLDEFERMVSQPCHYCGDYEVMGVDRVDNRIGYLISNSVPCCFECNFMKRNMDKYRFVNRAVKIAKHQEKLAKLKTAQSGKPLGPVLLASNDGVPGASPEVS